MLIGMLIDLLVLRAIALLGIRTAQTCSLRMMSA